MLPFAGPILFDFDFPIRRFAGRQRALRHFSLERNVRSRASGLTSPGRKSGSPNIALDGLHRGGLLPRHSHDFHAALCKVFLSLDSVASLLETFMTVHLDIYLCCRLKLHQCQMYGWLNVFSTQNLQKNGLPGPENPHATNSFGFAAYVSTVSLIGFVAMVAIGPGKKWFHTISHSSKILKR